MNNQALAEIFSYMASYYEMNDVPFKPQAYERAALGLGSLSTDVRDIYERGGIKALQEISGVGKSMAEHIEEYLSIGTVKQYEEFRKKMPVNIEELAAIEGLGPKKIKVLYKKLGIRTIDDLEEAAKQGKLRMLPGFGAKTEKNILQGIEFVKKEGKRRLLGYAYPTVEDIVSKLKALGFVREAVSAGSVRRMKETIGDVDILVTTDKPQDVAEHFLSVVPYAKVWGMGPTKISIRTNQGLDIDVRVLPEESYGAGLQYFTGSKEHNVKLRTYAASKGLKVSEYGVFRGKKRIAGHTEEEVYEAIGLSYIEPELREDTGEIEAAFRQAQGKRPGLPNLIAYDALRGDLQVQTDWTDGAHSIEEMAKEAKKQGLEYIVITDHTRDLAMTGGSDEKRLLLQMEEIDKLNKKISGITILKGAEVNIRADGTLDIADDVLAKLDVVGAAVHSYFKMSKKEMTARIVRAMQNPHVDILFHPTGRLIQRREPYQVDVEELIKVAAKSGTILEIDAHPERLDLKDIYIKKAIEGGARLAIDSDAHSKDHFRFLRFGIAQARRGWAEEKDIVNTLPLSKLLASLKGAQNV